MVVKISLALILAALLPLAAAVTLATLQSRRELEASTRRNMQLLAHATAARLDQLITDASRTVRQIALDHAVVGLCSENPVAGTAGAGPAGGPAAVPGDMAVAAQRRLEAVVGTNADFAAIYITDAAGVGLVSTNPLNVGVSFGFREYIRRALAGNAFVSEFLVGKTTGEAGVYFSAPVRARAGDPATPVVGTVALKLRGERIWELIDEVKVGQFGHAILVDDAGIVIAHRDRAALYHSLGPLTPQQIAAINPEVSYSLATVHALGMPGLMPAATDATTEGSVSYSAPPAGTGPREPWVAGYSRMKERGWKVFVVEPRRQFDQASARLMRQQSLIAVVVAVLAAALAVWRARAIVRPVVALTAAANQLASGDFSARAPRFADDEVGRLASTFNAMVPQLQERVTLQQSLAVAMEVQQSLLPAADPMLERLDVAGRSRYCDATGGDYYDFIDLARGGPGATLIAVGDVMGHGIGSALLMASARAALRSHAADPGPLSALLHEVNRVLAADGHNRFMTLALVEINPDAGTVRWASAGHDPTIVYHPADDSFEELEGGDVPLGILADAEFNEHHKAGLRTGDVLVIGTDGIWEMRDAARQHFGKDRLREVVREHRGRPAAQIAAALEQRLAAFRGAGPQEDDVTFVVIVIQPEQASRAG